MHARHIVAHLAASIATLMPLIAPPAHAAPRRIEEESIASLTQEMAAGTITSEKAVRAYLARIAAMDRKGPRLNSIITLNPHAIAEARALDAERRAGKLRGPLHGIPVLIKDNIETLGMPTTAGSLALKDNDNGRDAPVVAALKAQGALILGKTNLSEWANIRSERSMSGWSAIGGLTRNPYALDRTTCGSSSGSGAAVAAGFAPGAVGTETNGSVVCPSSMTGLAGLKPTVGLISRTHVVPISHSQDTPGPMARTVRDVAMMLSAMVSSDASSDPGHPATKDAMAHARDYAAALDASVLKGLRIGYIRKGGQPDMLARFDEALALLKGAGAELVAITPPDDKGEAGAKSYDVLKYELKADLNAYLATTSPQKVKTRTLADLIAFDKTEAAWEMPLFGQEIFEMAQAKGGLDDPAYLEARATSLRLAGKDGIDRMLADNKVSLILMISYGPAWPSDTVWGDQYEGPGGTSSLPAIAGYPHLTVPMGLARGLPVGLSFIGPAWSEQLLLDAGYGYEQAAKLRLRPDFRASADMGPALEGTR
ncbi:amidase [Sphingobium sp. H39-3-25]|uniref:amidase n=1 Tax=Sphingobium arseniciresistens TaxID=3030834 RepID=UPI0023B8FEC0|nr:amidase [Sphingobium arseniciresistens]